MAIRLTVDGLWQDAKVIMIVNRFGRKMVIAHGLTAHGRTLNA